MKNCTHVSDLYKTAKIKPSEHQLAHAALQTCDYKGLVLWMADPEENTARLSLVLSSRHKRPGSHHHPLSRHAWIPDCGL